MASPLQLREANTLWSNNMKTLSILFLFSTISASAFAGPTEECAYKQAKELGEIGKGAAGSGSSSAIESMAPHFQRFCAAAITQEGLSHEKAQAEVENGIARAIADLGLRDSNDVIASRVLLNVLRTKLFDDRTLNIGFPNTVQPGRSYTDLSGHAAVGQLRAEGALSRAYATLSGSGTLSNNFSCRMLVAVGTQTQRENPQICVVNIVCTPPRNATDLAPKQFQTQQPCAELLPSQGY